MDDFKQRLIRASKQRKVLLKNNQSPGDILMLTAAVRDLKISHPDILIGVKTSCMELWENNPYIDKVSEDDPSVEIYNVGYPIIHESNDGQYHFIHGFRKDIEEQLNLKIKPTVFWGDIHFSQEELSWVSMIHQHFTGKNTPFWLICSGGKTDYTTKWWLHEYAQEVVDYFKNKIQFVQFGAEGKEHFHPALKGVINLVGKTNLRMFMRLAYSSDGIISPITFAMHLAAALPQKPNGPRHKPCIVTAGGREPSTFTRYTNHQYLHTNGMLFCCQNGGCWKSRTSPIGDGDYKDNKDQLCVNTVTFNGREVQRCMHDFITPEEVIVSVEKYYRGGMLKYLPDNYKSIEANWEDRIGNKEKPIIRPSKEKCLMGDETFKTNNRRSRDLRFVDKFFVGRGIDIGAGGDLLNKAIFTKISEIELFDLSEGDAEFITQYKKEEDYDFVYSSHCLEHMVNPCSAVQEWFKLVKKEGYLIVVVPDEDLYEQGVFPSRFNPDHKNTFTIYKQQSWCEKSINVIDLIKTLKNSKIIKIDLIDGGYDYSKKDVDQTGGMAEANIEFIIQKI